MKEITYYYIDGHSRPFFSKEAAEKEERNLIENFERWKNNSAISKLEKLKFDLDNQSYIPDTTIATCSHDSLSVKAMVKVCQKFVEDHKEYLCYY